MVQKRAYITLHVRVGLTGWFEIGFRQDIKDKQMGCNVSCDWDDVTQQCF